MTTARLRAPLAIGKQKFRSPPVPLHFVSFLAVSKLLMGLVNNDFPPLLRQEPAARTFADHWNERRAVSRPCDCLSTYRTLLRTKTCELVISCTWFYRYSRGFHWDSSTWLQTEETSSCSISDELDAATQAVMESSCALIAKTIDNIFNACSALGYSNLTRDHLRVVDDWDSDDLYLLPNTLPILIMPYYDNTPYSRHAIPTWGEDACVFRL
ncbi:hypothetical protein V7S43_013394 [Phytophthora oleae]|uniref:Uncharacterized protein n=1 Tax=Phytophthora oleae TaxID=2107226 RepID=A0ABD3F488_9STRA